MDVRLARPSHRPRAPSTAIALLMLALAIAVFPALAHAATGRAPGPPTITAPHDGDVVGGDVRVEGHAGSGATGVQVAVDGGPWQDANGTGPWRFVWDSAGAAAGAHAISARSIDSGGNSTPATVSVTVSSRPPARIETDPTMTPTTTTAGQTVRVTGTAAYDNGVRVVWANATARVLATATTASAPLDALGTYSLTFVAPDRAGRRTVSITVDDGQRNVTVNRTLTITSPTQPELGVAGLTCDPASPIAGRGATLRVTVENTGNSTASATLKVSDGTKQDSPLIAQQRITVDPGAATSVDLRWDPGAGNHTVEARLEGIAPEDRNQTNDVRRLPVTVRVLPDFIVDAVNLANPRPGHGNATSVSISVRNRGSAEGSGKLVLTAIGGPSGKDPAQVLVGEQRVDLPANGSRSVVLRWTPTHGRWTLSARVVDVLPEETDPADNERSSAVVEVPKPPPPPRRVPGPSGLFVLVALAVVGLALERRAR